MLLGVCNKYLLCCEAAEGPSNSSSSRGGAPRLLRARSIVLKAAIYMYDYGLACLWSRDSGAFGSDMAKCAVQIRSVARLLNKRRTGR